MTFDVIAAMVLLMWAGAAVIPITVVTRLAILDAIEGKLTWVIAGQSAVARLIAALTLVACAAGAATLLRM